MTLKDDLKQDIAEIFRAKWEDRVGFVVPADSSIKLSNDAVKIDGAVLYADISDSTSLVQTATNFVAAELYKSFLRCAAKIIIAEGGTITAYDGDRAMAVFVGSSKESDAVRAALKINWAVKNIINPGHKAVYKDSTIVLNHVVGIDTSALFVARTGVRGANDLVWVGRAANVAAKLTSLSHSYPTYITRDVYAALDIVTKYARSVDMWKPFTWTGFNNSSIYGSTYWWQMP